MVNVLVSCLWIKYEEQLVFLPDDYNLVRRWAGSLGSQWRLTVNLSWGRGGLHGGGLQSQRTRSGAGELGVEVGWEVGLPGGGTSTMEMEKRSTVVGVPEVKMHLPIDDPWILKFGLSLT